MAKAKFKWNMKAFRELRNDPKVREELLKRGNRIAAACGPGYQATESEEPDPTRARVYVRPATSRARKDNAVNNTLLRNLDAGR